LKAINIVRNFTLFGVLAAILMVILNTMESIDSIRPHGATLIILAIVGIVIPLIGIITSQKMKNFFQELFWKNIPNFIVKRNQIQPQ